MVQKEDKIRIIRGLVFYQGHWIPIGKKIEFETNRRKRIEQGYVFYQGNWMSIEDKITRLTPAAPPGGPSQVIINQTFNQQRYEQKTIHEHRHVHIDGQTFADAFTAGSQLADSKDNVVRIEDQDTRNAGGRRKNRRLADHTPHQKWLDDSTAVRYLEDQRKSTDAAPSDLTQLKNRRKSDHNKKKI